MAVDRIPIGKFSLITRLSSKALRLYDERGLLVPEVRDIITGYRYYTGDQIPRGVSIKTLCTLGFPLTEVETILAAKERRDNETIHQLFARRRRDIRSEVCRLQQIEAILETPDVSLEVVYMSLAEPVVKEIAPLRVICKRDKGVYAEVICKLARDLCGQLEIPENRSPAVTVTGPFMSIYHDNEYQEKDADIECAIPVSGRVVVTDPAIGIRTIPKNTCLSVVYKGPYQGLHEAWSRVLAYAEEREFPIAGDGKELYYNEPGKVPDEDLLTELQLPITR
ncbi:GyrI-like domain-containing protein [Methanoregula sp.]|uniref:MerR family transcriptional regulator n=1 Tax=Methanoregula sp. TaxID=2052170 RepID=UPI003569AB39